MDHNIKNSAIVRFAVLATAFGLSPEEVAAFGTFQEADAYVKENARKHVAFNIVDRNKNVVATEADDAEANDIARRMEIAKQRQALIALEAENAAREAALKTPASA